MVSKSRTRESSSFTKIQSWLIFVRLGCPHVFVAEIAEALSSITKKVAKNDRLGG